MDKEVVAVAVPTLEVEVVAEAIDQDRIMNTSTTTIITDESTVKFLHKKQRSL